MGPRAHPTPATSQEYEEIIRILATPITSIVTADLTDDKQAKQAPTKLFTMTNPKRFQEKPPSELGLPITVGNMPYMIQLKSEATILISDADHFESRK